jgi:hypothetical protein
MGGPEREARDVAAPAKPEPHPSDGAATSFTVAGKSCGSCTKCCTVMGVPELKKRPWDTCPHVAAGTGCTIYATRPGGCRTFICGWLLDPDMGPDLKPENCHVVLYQRDEQHIIAACDAAFPDAWRQPNVIDFLHRLAKVNAPRRRVLLMEKGRLWYVNEDAIVPTDTG